MSNSATAKSCLPLEGVRILDLTHVIAGPLATHQLCMMGAKVIKIERPEEGDGMRAIRTNPDEHGTPPQFRALNAGKQSVVLDLKDEQDKNNLLALAKSCDVFIENFRPGAAKRLGLSAADIRKVRPDVIYCSISGWGQEGELSPLPAYDHIIQAATGMMAMQGVEGPFVKVGFPVIDTATGMSATTAILAALLRRANGDTSDIEIDVSMIDSAMLLMTTVYAQTIYTGKAPERMGNQGFVGSPGTSTFKTYDGYLSTAANTMGQFRCLCKLVGRPDLAQPPYLPAGLSENDFLFGLKSPELDYELETELLKLSATTLEKALMAEGVPAARVRNLHEFLTELYGKTPGISVPGEPLSLLPGFRSQGAFSQELRATPELGEHSGKI